MKTALLKEENNQTLPKSMTLRPRCDTCHYSIGSVYWFCRRYPPVVAGGEFSHIVIQPDDWCGEYKEREVII